LQWLKSVILAIQKTEIGRITVGDQPRKKVCEIPSQSVNGWVWWHVPVILAIQRRKNRRIIVQAGPGIQQGPILKIANTKRAGGVT
jgi:hypothetical protein